MDTPISRVLFTEEQIKSRVKQLGKQLAREYAGKPLVVLGVLNGGAIFCADLVRAMDIPLGLAFVRASSYGDGTVSRGEADIFLEQGFSARGRHVLIAEDIADTGKTLAALKERLLSCGALSVKVCCMLNKPSRRQVAVRVDHVGFDIPDEFVVGYGLDYAGRFRNLPYIGVLSREAYGG